MFRITCRAPSSPDSSVEFSPFSRRARSLRLLICSPLHNQPPYVTLGLVATSILILIVAPQRADVLEAAWQTVRRNGGVAGVDGETVQRIEAQGVERWLGELARDLKEGSYRPGAVRQVLIPKKQAGKYRALGIPCVRDRVAQTAALVVLAPIFEADLEPEQYAYREGCSAQDAVQRVHRL